jgi:hypothetical protein
MSSALKNSTSVAGGTHKSSVTLLNLNLKNVTLDFRTVLLAHASV